MEVFLNKELVDLLTKHMMRSVDDRYAVFKKLDFEDRVMGLLKLEGSAWAVAVGVTDLIQQYYGEEKTESFYEVLKGFDLPEWMSSK